MSVSRAGFIEERCVVSPRAEAPATPLYNAYQEWRKSNGEAEENQRRFGGRLHDRGFESFVFTSGAFKGRKGWRGIGLRSHDPGPCTSTMVDVQSSTDVRNAAQGVYHAGDGGDEGLRGRPTVGDHLLGESRVSKHDTPDAPERVDLGRPKNGINGLNDLHEGVIPKEGQPSSTRSTGGENPDESHAGVGWIGSSKEAGQKPQDAAELLTNQPDWLVTEIRKCHEDPARFLKRTANSMAYELYGSVERWREVLPVLKAHVEDEAGDVF
jgi:hypothetical protein